MAKAKKPTVTDHGPPDPPGRRGRRGPLPTGRITSALNVKAGEKWRDWLRRFAESEGIERTKLIDAALATHAALRRFEPPPDREA